MQRRSDSIAYLQRQTESASRKARSSYSKVTLVNTIVNTVNSDNIGGTVNFAVRNIDKIHNIAFQPVSFTGRDEGIDDATRHKQRYTLSQMVQDLKIQLHADWEPLRDWFPLSSYSAFTSIMDMLQGADAPWGWSGTKKDFRRSRYR
jgi:uncharacterized radical SAM superfamily Fe-S cluster-containing enzyme